MNRALLNDLVLFFNARLKECHVEGEQMSLTKGCCFTVSKMAQQILRKLGYDCEVRRVRCMIANKIAWPILDKQFKEKHWDSKEIVDAGGHSMGLGYGDGAGDFHYVVHFPKEKEFMDLTFGICNRPEKGIIAEPYWANYEKLPECLYQIEMVRNNKAHLGALYFRQSFTKWRKEAVNDAYRLLKKYKVR